MKVALPSILALSTAVAALTCPANSGGGCGEYSVSGLGSRKQQIRTSGGSAEDLAIAMMETERMDTNYAWVSCISPTSPSRLTNCSYGDNKQGDAANFGIFKQNWGMLRSSCNLFMGQTSSQWNNGAVLNSNLGADLTCRHQSESHYGFQKLVNFP